MAVTTADAAHLLRRSGFGVTKAKLAEITALESRTAAVNRVLDLSAVPPANPPKGNESTDQFTNWSAMTDWWLERMRTSPVPIVEKLTLFWHGHFASGLDKVPSMEMLIGQHKTLRAFALGDFHALAQAISIDPAMLWYLDNALNTKTLPQENFGRELMELFTLGVGNYSQGDVVSMTRAWTGHSVDDSFAKYQFRSAWHDTGNKVLFGRTARNWDGPAALTEVLKGSKATVASQFITAKLFSFLAYPVPVTAPIVVSLAKTFRSSGLNILALVRAIFLSREFWSAAARNALVRSPVEWFVASMQAVNLPMNTVPAQASLPRVGHTLFVPPDVSGWKQNEYWLTTSGMWGRSFWASHVRYYAWQAGLFAGVEGKPPAEVAQIGFDQFGITHPSATTRRAVEAWCARAQAEGDWWSIPANLAQLMMLSPEFMVS